MDIAAMLDALGRFLSPSAASVGGPRLPEWEGWLALGLLFVVFGALVWWLYLSPLTDPDSRVERAPLGPRARHVLAVLVLLSGVCFTLGARWDELWHRLYGGFGDDFLWPPHLLIYGSLGLNSAFAGLGLAVAARGSGGPRERFRANPLVGLLGLLAAYQLASIPSDLIWHKIIGPDISAWSLPHLLLVVSSSAVLAIGLALALAGGAQRHWRVGVPLRPADLVALLFVVVSTLSLLQFGVTEWEWRDGIGMPFGRAVWVYPVVVLTIGVVESHLALFSVRRVGAATLAISIALVAQLGFVVYARASLPPGPSLVSHLLLLLPAVALDLYYAVRRGQLDRLTTLAAGVGVFAAVFVAEIFLLLGRLMPYPLLTFRDVGWLVLLGLGVAVVAVLTLRAVVGWLLRSEIDGDRRDSVGQLEPRWPVSLAR
jgi:hypothetical protein